MAKIIADLYEIRKKLGSGGFGTVYLGYHLRLDKPVALKAYKRKLKPGSYKQSVTQQKLRQEVDILKKLNHQYLPQVYDFVETEEETDNGSVESVFYTVMDYIQGDNFEDLLERGERFEQKQVVEWACQLLEALCYLHSRPPHGILHADIKPANIMLVEIKKQDKDGNITEVRKEVRLIDFNIALALDVDGAARLGYSPGYASPEQYGFDYTHPKTEGLPSDETELVKEEGETLSLSGSGSVRRNGVPLDVRSDIYSLGATLYHILTGECPHEDARKVRPISQWAHISPPLAAIIEKAMNPEPDLRYQTAEEMLRAFERLHKDDPRSVAHRRAVRVSAILSAAIFLIGGLVTFVGLKRQERYHHARELAEYSADALRQGDVEQAITYALEALPEKRGLLDPPYVPQAQWALTNALGVYDLSDGYKPHLSIPLASEPMKAALSPDGSKAVALLRVDNQWLIQVFDTETGQEIVTLPAEHSALSSFVFKDNDTLIYAGENSLCAYNLKEHRELWSTGIPATAISLSGNGEVVASVYQDADHAEIYDAETGDFWNRIDFHGRGQAIPVSTEIQDTGNNLFALSAAGTWLAVSLSGGGLRLYNRNDSDLYYQILDTSEYWRFEGGFYDSCFALSAFSGEESAFFVFDLESMNWMLRTFGTLAYHVQAGEAGIYLSNGTTLVKLDPYSAEQTTLAKTVDNIRRFSCSPEYSLVLTGNNSYALFSPDARKLDEYVSEEGSINFASAAGDFILSGSLDKRELLLRKIHRHSEAQLFTYDLTFRHRGARVHTDGQTAMLYYNQFMILDKQGQVITVDDSIANPDPPYDTKYLRNPDGDILQVLYADGTERYYSAKTGERLLPDGHQAPPDQSLGETFKTEHYRIDDPHHGTPVIYDRDSGKQRKVLEEDANLCWAEERGESLVLLWMRIDNNTFYGQILDRNFEPVADLPNLCDVLSDGTLVFDDTFGNLRRSRVYPIQDLISLAKQRIKFMEVTQ